MPVSRSALPVRTCRLFPHAALLAGVSMISLMVASAPADARNLFNRSANSAAAAAATAAAQAGAQQAAMAASQATIRINASLRAMRDQLAVRRVQALSGAGMPPINGQIPGGLVVSPGVATDPTLWQGANRPKPDTVSNGRTQVEVVQTAPKAILTWQTFNVGRETDLYFNQTAGRSGAANWIALNRVLDPSAAPSRILGTIKAEGGVYVINKNGIIFGGSSQVNVNSLIVSSLDIAGDTIAARDQKFMDGILFNPNEATKGTQLTFGDKMEDSYPSSSPLVPNPVVKPTVNSLPGETFVRGDGVTIEAGARIKTDSFGHAMFFGHYVVNEGTVESPDGQVLLAAGRGIYLARNIHKTSNAGNFVLDPDLRGVISNVNRGGAVENFGLISSDRGNVTLNGKSVLQAGIVQATTSATQNGSITLKAGDATSLTTTYPYSRNFGGLTLAEDSLTVILPDTNGEKAVGFDQFRPSKIDFYGRQIEFGRNSLLYAPGASMTVDATGGAAVPDYLIDPITGKPVQSGNSYVKTPDPGRIYLDRGATIDLGGLRGVEVAMERNTIKAELRANELRDNPLLRNSFLRGKTIYFDARDGVEIADLSGYYDLIARDVRELMTSGGSLQLKGPEVITRAGSVIDLSGGSLRYLGGYVRSTILISQAGRRVRIEDAVPGEIYVGIEGGFTRTHARWGVTETWNPPLGRSSRRYDPGYAEGRAAGSLRIGATQFEDAPASEADFRIFDGDIVADVVVGRDQTAAPSGAAAKDVTRVWRERPTGASLAMGWMIVRNSTPDNAMGTPQYTGGNVTIGTADVLPDSFAAGTALDRSGAYSYVLPERYFDGKTFSKVTLYSGVTDSDANGIVGGRLTIGQGTVVDLGDFGSFNFFGTRADIGGTIRGVSGSVSIVATNLAASEALQTGDWTATPDASRPQINLGAQAVIDVSGRWIDEHVDPSATAAINGGSVSLVSSHNLRLAQGSLIDVSGGGRLSAAGNKVVAGDAGAITLVNSHFVGQATNVPAGPRDGDLILNGTLRGYALGNGGKLTIATGRGVTIGDAPIWMDTELQAGTTAPLDLVLAADTVVPAGSVFPMSVTAILTQVPAGASLPFSVTPRASTAAPILAAANWVVPSNVTSVRVGTTTYATGQTVPAGSLITTWTNRTAFPAGYVIPKNVFPNGWPIQSVTSTFAKGTTTTIDVVIPVQTVIPAGTPFQRAVNVQPLLHLKPGFFNQGGFAHFGIAGSAGVTIAENTVIAPQVQSYMLDRAAWSAGPGSRLSDIARLTVREEAYAQPTSLTLSGPWVDLSAATLLGVPQFPLQADGVHPGKVTVGRGAEIRLAPESTVRLLSYSEIFVDGLISAPGGEITLSVKSIDASGTTAAAPGIIRLGPHAQLLAPGYVKWTPDGRAVRRSVEAGGAVSLGLFRSTGANVSVYVMTDVDSVMNVSGVAAVADFAKSSSGPDRSSPYAQQLVHGHAGQISITATSGVLAGELEAAPGGETGRGGTITITRVGSASPGATGAPVLRVTQSLPDALAEVTRTSSLDGAQGGLTVFADRINGSGADAAALLSTGGILFAGDVSLHARASLRLGAVTLAGTGGNVDIESSRVIFDPSTSASYSFPATTPPALASTVGGSLMVNAGVIDVVYGFDLGCGSAACVSAGLGTGFRAATFAATGDIRLHSQSRPQSARIQSGGSLHFAAAQVYTTSSQPTGLTSDNGFLINAAGTVSFARNGAAAGVPLSYGSRLTVRAPRIEQSGILRAPYGEIILQATESVTFLPGSLTSIALEGAIVPIGKRIEGFDVDSKLASGGYTRATVRADGPNVAIQDGAVIDVSGGGDLMAYQFIAGNGGSKDLLDPGSGYFAIVPGLGAGPTPQFVGTSPSVSGVLTAGDVVHLEGVSGLPAGDYTLLPASYALASGGMLIQAFGNGGYAGPRPAHTVPDGSVLVSGYRLGGTTPAREAGSSQYRLLSQAVFGQYSQIVPLSFNEHIANRNAAAAGAAATGVSAATLRSVLDAGALVLGATRSLALNGSGRFEAAPGGRLGRIDIAAAKIVVTDGLAPVPGGYLAVDVNELNAFGAGSLFIGGTRSVASTGTTLQVAATDVVVDNRSAPLVAPEILLGAKNSVSLADGAVISAIGAAIGDTNPLAVVGNGALLRASVDNRVGFTRTGANDTSGVLTVGAGVQLQARGSVSLDASGSLLIDERAVIDAAQLDLSSVIVNLGDAPATVTGTVLSNATLARLGTARELTIRGFQSIDLYGDVRLGWRNAEGVAALGAVTFDTVALRGFAQSGEAASITAGTLTLRNSGAGASSAPATGAGVLKLDADTLVLGPGEIDISGYAGVSALAGRLQGRGTGGIDIAGYATIAVDLVTAAAGSDTGLRATGDLSLTAGRGTAQTATDFGGRLAVAGARTLIDTRVGMPGGIFEAAATNDLALGAAADIDMRGVTVDFRDVVRHADGGGIRLSAGTGVTMAAGARLDVSADARGGNAGWVEVTTGGDVAVAAAIAGIAAEGGSGGAFALKAGRLSDFVALNALLETGGFNRSRAIQVASGDLVLGTGQTLTAHDVVLRSDGGRVSVSGTINASGTAADADGGTIRLIGGNGVGVSGAGRLIARAGTVASGDFAPDSGLVEIAAIGGRVNVAAGAAIDVSGGKQGGGSVIVRAVRDANHDGVYDDIAIDRIDGRFVGARELIVEGARTYAASVVDAALVGNVLAHAGSWMGNAAVIADIRARISDPGFEIRPGIVIESAGNLAINTDIDLHAARYNGAPGSLRFVATGAIADTGDVVVNGSISDGFSTAAAATGQLLGGKSWDLGFTSARDVTLGAGKLIRTGTGDISIVAGRNLVLTDDKSVIYTAGARTAPEAGFAPIAGRTIGEFPTQGGDISLTAGRDILAPITKQAAASWLFRYGNSNWTNDPATSTITQQTSWSIMFANFQHGIGALGGGSIDIAAGRDISQLALSLPTTGHMTTAVGAVARPGDVHVRGGGDLTITAGRDLLGGVFLIGEGEANIRVGGALKPSDTQVMLRTGFAGSSGYAFGTVGALFALMDGAASVVSRQGARIEGAFDPMSFQGQTCANIVTCSDANRMGFNSQTGRTAIAVTSLTGDVVDRQNPWASVDLSRGNGAYESIVGLGSSSAGQGYGILNQQARVPGTVKYTALQGGIDISTKYATLYVLAPTDNGALEMLAASDLRGSASMLDMAEPYRRGSLNPYGFGTATTFTAATNYDRGFTPSHVNDPDPVRVYAMSGTGAMSVTAPKPIYAYAARDLSAAFSPQHNHPDDVSYFIAGRDVTAGVIVSGPGSVVVEGGRHVKAEVISAGNHPNRHLTDAQYLNLALPDNQGADIYVFAGAAKPTDYDAFAAAFLDPNNGAGVVRTYLPELRSYMAKLGYTGGSDTELAARFAALPLESRKPFLQQVFFTELKETGIDVTDPTSPRHQNYERGYRAIALLFPRDAATLPEIERANVLIGGRTIETQAGGSTTILAPYGRIEVGKVNSVANDFGTGGVITRKGGDIRMMSDGNIDLYVSRVFTLQGGDITLWTSNGDITAGAGAKTTTFRPPLTYALDNNAVSSLNIFGLQTGAGIGVLDSGGTGERKTSRMDLIAPRGEVNAGDAGIRVVGDINIAALRIVGIDNIQVSGAAVGIPKPTAPDVGGQLSADQVAGAATKSVDLGPRTAPSSEHPSIIMVEVIGYGGDGETAPRRDEDQPDRRSDSRGQDPHSRYQVVGVGALTEEEANRLADEKRRQLGR